MYTVMYSYYNRCPLWPAAARVNDGPAPRLFCEPTVAVLLPEPAGASGPADHRRGSTDHSDHRSTPAQHTAQAAATALQQTVSFPNGIDRDVGTYCVTASVGNASVNFLLLVACPVDSEYFCSEL